MAEAASAKMTWVEWVKGLMPAINQVVIVASTAIITFASTMALQWALIKPAPIPAADPPKAPTVNLGPAMDKLTVLQGEVGKVGEELAGLRKELARLGLRPAAKTAEKK